MVSTNHFWFHLLLGAKVWPILNPTKVATLKKKKKEMLLFIYLNNILLYKKRGSTPEGQRRVRLSGLTCPLYMA